MTNHHLPRIAIHVATLLITAGIGCAQAAAASPKAQPGTSSPAKKLPGKVSFHEAPSSEKPGERAKRLKRECKGRPNAGMCLGYTN